MRSRLLAILLLTACLSLAVDVDAKRKDKPPTEKKVTPTASKPHDGKAEFAAGKPQKGHDAKPDKGHDVKPGHDAKSDKRLHERLSPPPPPPPPLLPPPGASGAVTLAHSVATLLQLGALLYACFVDASHSRSLIALGAVTLIESVVHLVLPVPWVSISMVITVSVLFTINPVSVPKSSPFPLPLHMGTVPFLAVLWLGAVRILSWSDFVRALYGTETLRPYHLVVMFLGSVYLCTALERSGFLHTAAVKVVTRYGRSPWGAFLGPWLLLGDTDSAHPVSACVSTRVCGAPKLLASGHADPICLLPTRQGRHRDDDADADHDPHEPAAQPARDSVSLLPVLRGQHLGGHSRHWQRATSRIRDPRSRCTLATWRRSQRWHTSHG